MAASSVVRMHAIGHAALKQAVRWQLVGRNVSEAVEIPKGRRPVVRALDAEGAARLLAAAKGGPVYGFIALALYTDLRRGELLPQVGGH